MVTSSGKTRPGSPPLLGQLCFRSLAKAGSMLGSVGVVPLKLYSRLVMAVQWEKPIEWAPAGIHDA